MTHLAKSLRATTQSQIHTVHSGVYARMVVTGLFADEEIMSFVYFVLPGRNPELYASSLANPGRTILKTPKFSTGPECWILKTWHLLSQQSLPFKPVLVGQAVPGEVCVFHYEHAKPKYGAQTCFAVVAQADRPAPPLADMVIVQNQALKGKNAYHIPHWTQDGLIARDSSRGVRIESIAFMGNKRYIPPFFSSPQFLSGLQQLGVTPLWRSADDWHDYKDVDITLAYRELPLVEEKTKPALKLVNAWLAGAPIILRPEVAYAEIRMSSLDYLEARDAIQVLEGIQYLQDNPTVYEAMITNGRRRAEDFDDSAIRELWVDVLGKALKKNKTTGKNNRWIRVMTYKLNRMRTRIWKHLTGWRD